VTFVVQMMFRINSITAMPDSGVCEASKSHKVCAKVECIYCFEALKCSKNQIRWKKTEKFLEK